MPTVAKKSDSGVGRECVRYAIEDCTYDGAMALTGLVL